MTSVYVRPYTLWGGGGGGKGQVLARRGEENVINRAMHSCNRRFSWRDFAHEVAWPTSSRSKTCLL